MLTIILGIVLAVIIVFIGFAIAVYTREIKYVFYVPEGTISKDVKLN